MMEIVLYIIASIILGFYLGRASIKRSALPFGRKLNLQTFNYAEFYLSNTEAIKWANKQHIDVIGIQDYILEDGTKQIVLWYYS